MDKNNTYFLLKKNDYIYDTEDGDLLAYYYFFVDKQNYSLEFNFYNPLNVNQEIAIIVKQNEKIKKYDYIIKNKENIITIPIKGNNFNERIFFYIFSKNYDKIILKYVKINKNL
jgi:hypothetical protein